MEHGNIEHHRRDTDYLADQRVSNNNERDNATNNDNERENTRFDVDNDHHLVGRDKSFARDTTVRQLSVKTTRAIPVCRFDPGR